MGKYSRLGKNILLVFIGNAGAKIIGLLMLPFYTRWLSVEDYGTTDIINVYVTLLLSIVTACIADSVFIFPKGAAFEKQKNYFSSGLFLSFISLLSVGVVFKGISTIFHEISNSFIDNIWLIYGLLVSTFIQQYVQQFSRSIDKMVVYSISGIVLTVFTALFSFLIIPVWGVFGYVLALIFANLLAAIYSFVFSGSFKYLAITAIHKTSCAEMLKYSVPLIPNVIMWWLVSALNRPLMANYSGMDGVGIFAVANKFPAMLSVLFTIFATSWQISVMEEFGKDGYEHFFNKMFRLVIFSLIFLFFAVTVCSKLFVSLFATEAFYEAWKYIPVLTLGVIFQSISGFTGSNFSATRESKYFFYSSMWGGLSAVVFNFILIPWIGIMGAAISVCLSFAVMSISRIRYGWKYVKITNIKTCLFLLLIAVLTVVAFLNIQIEMLKYSVMFILFITFLLLNYNLKNDFMKLTLTLKAKIVK